MRTLNYNNIPIVPSLPIPVSSLSGVFAKQTTHKAPYWCDGLTWSRVLVGATAAALSFGTVPVYAKAFTISDGGANVGDSFMVTTDPTGDEYEMDALMLQGKCLTAGFITIYAHAVPGPVTGIRNIKYVKV